MNSEKGDLKAAKRDVPAEQLNSYLPAGRARPLPCSTALAGDSATKSMQIRLLVGQLPRDADARERTAPAAHPPAEQT